MLAKSTTTTANDIGSLVRSAQRGDREAFGELVARFEPAVYATALARLRDHLEAQELCQEVFIKALEKIEQLIVPEAFGGWIKQITVRMAINRLVRRSPVVATEPEVLEGTCAHSATPLQGVLANERRQSVHAGLARLGDLDRETLTAFYFRSRSLLEMSDEFAAPVGTIKRRLHVARKRLARELADLAV